MPSEQVMKRSRCLRNYFVFKVIHITVYGASLSLAVDTSMHNYGYSMHHLYGFGINILPLCELTFLYEAIEDQGQDSCMWPWVHAARRDSHAYLYIYICTS